MPNPPLEQQAASSPLPLAFTLCRQRQRHRASFKYLKRVNTPNTHAYAQGVSPVQKYILRLSSKIKTELAIFVIIYSYCYNQQGCQLSAVFSLFLPALAHLSLLFAAYTSLSSSLSLLPPTLICIVAPSWRHPVLKDSLTATKTFRGSCSSFLALSLFHTHTLLLFYELFGLHFYAKTITLELPNVCQKFSSCSPSIFVAFLLLSGSFSACGRTSLIVIAALT